jgi:FkbM family methyltransferase
MSFKSKFNKYARKIASALTHFDNEGLGKDPLRDMARRVQGSDLVIFDVGANVGQSIERFKKYFPDAAMYSFEPSSKAFALLEQKANAYANVSPYKMALGAQSGEMTLFENSSSDMNSFLEMGSGGSGEIVGQAVVLVKTIDQFCTENSISKIDILKIDAQGFDFEVIKGAKESILANKVKLLYFEIIFSEMYKNVPRFSEVYDFLLDHDFVLVSLYQFHYQESLAGWTDGLFIHKSALQ